MAKATRPDKSAESKAPEPKAEETFVNLMMVAADFASSRGGIDAAKQALDDAGRFIQQAGSVAQANRALEVLENLRTKIGS
jgi:hypothetical protein